MPRSKRLAFDIKAAIPAAWHQLWAENLKQRKVDEKYFRKYGKRAYSSATTYYITAASIQRLVRENLANFAHDQGHRGNVRISGDLQRAVRSWLFSQVRLGKLVDHNFGKGHISGARFRPFGEPISDAESKTIKAIEKRRTTPRPMHYSSEHRAACQPPRKSYSFRSRPSNAARTSNVERVTCKRCLKLMATMPKAKAAPAPQLECVS